jgi:hypothetical protein
MATDVPTSQTEEFVERRVRYSLDLSDRFVVIENVPSRVSSLTGEQFFTPQTVERIWEIVHSGKRPARVIETDVFDFQ